MKRLFASLVLATVLYGCSTAGYDINVGDAAYRAGDYATALQLWKPLAEQGYASAQYKLGLMYAEGEGVPEDYVQAYMWFNLAAAQGNEAAKKRKDLVVEQMTREQIAEAQRLSREFRSREDSGGGANSDVPARLDKPPDVGGSGFVVAKDYVLTNAYVVSDCRAVKVHSGGQPADAQVVSRDAANGLALLRADGLQAVAARFSQAAVRLGDDVVVVGYPLHTLSASGLQLSAGTISALTGIGNDARMLQITAPAQVGNSGGPVLNSNGGVVGVVISKWDANFVEELIDNIPRNVNFAIRAPLVRLFLDSYGVAYKTVRDGRNKSTAEIAEEARRFTVAVGCWR